MRLFLGLVPFVHYGIELSLAAPGLFDYDEYDPSSNLDFFSSDQADLGTFTMEEPSDFTMLLTNNQEDIDPLASNDQLDWGTDDIFPYLGDGGNDDINFQQDFDLWAVNPSCAIDVPSDQGLKRDTLPAICPNQLAPDSDPQSRNQGKPPTNDPAKSPGSIRPGQSDYEHANLGDFYEGRDRDTIRGYVPGENPDSPCQKGEFAVCDNGDPFFRIPQDPPRYALEKCFICMFDFFLRSPRKSMNRKTSLRRFFLSGSFDLINKFSLFGD